MLSPPVDHLFNMRSLLSALLLAWGVGCSNPQSARERRPAPSVRGGTGIVAAVGERGIALDSLKRAIQQAGGDPRVRLEQLIELHAYGLYAEHGGLETGRRQTIERGIIARALLGRVELEANVPEVPSQVEVDAMTESRWLDLDRPEAVVVCHVVVHADRLSEAAGVALAQRLAETLRPLTQCTAFLEQAKAIPVTGAKVTAERLPPVTTDGRTMVLNAKGEPIDEGTPFDPDFARAANQLTSVGEQSSVIRTRFGWHVILLESRLSAKYVAFEERRKILTSDILLKRAQVRSEQLIADLRLRTPIALERAAIDAAARVRVDP